MSVSASFMATCRTKIAASSQYAAYLTAGVLADSTRAELVAQWHRVNTADSQGTSVVFRLRQEIRNIVMAQADIHAAAGSGVISFTDREEAVVSLTTEYAPKTDRPMSQRAGVALLEQAINEGQ